MVQNIIQKSCVRITSNGNQGSGVLFFNEQSHYVLTAAHCIGESVPALEKIIIEQQTDYTSIFNIIKVVKVVSFNKDEDFALIEIELNDDNNSISHFKLGRNFLSQDQIKFCGYQGLSKDQFRPFSGIINLVNTDGTKFQIKIIGDTFDQAGEDGQYVASGLSGSGVFLIKNGAPFLIGILNSVKTEKAWNDDIDCNSVKCIAELVKESVDLSEIESLKKWNENIEKLKTVEDIETFKSQSSDFFNNLDRKNKVLYDSLEKADNVTVKQIHKYLSLQENIADMEDRYPDLYVKFKEVVEKYRDQVNDDYSGPVESSTKARELKILLHNELKHELEAFIPSTIKIDLAEYQIIEWLGICTLNFTEQ